MLALPHNTTSTRMLACTLLIDHGVILVPSRTVEVRAFSLTRQRFPQRQAGARG
jgi:hypothetical protein